MKKTFIRTNWYCDDNDREKDRESLHRAGFYCLRADYCGLEVYALEDNSNWFDKVCELIGGK